MKTQKQRALRPLTLLLIFFCVAAAFAALWLGFELFGRLAAEEEPPEEAPAAGPEPLSQRTTQSSDGLIAGLARNPYDPDAFVEVDGFMTYTGGQVARRGVDVSSHQGTIDWAAVREAGVDFAIIRVGYRGYTEGVTALDDRFYDNVRGALESGVAVGVYFFSQAISVEEAEEEAEIVLRAIEGLDITYPVIFDWESIEAEARTDQMDPLLLTDCAEAFCRTVEAAGYTAGIYFNQAFGYQKFDLKALDKYVFWLAQLDDTPDFLYNFHIWQYTHQGSVDGIEGPVDLNLSFWMPEDPV